MLSSRLHIVIDRCGSVLQASQVVSSSMSGVAKAAVFPLFESAGRLHLALTGECHDRP
jgi:hypothetical protein